jgi:hypothetical protein
MQRFAGVMYKCAGDTKLLRCAQFLRNFAVTVSNDQLLVNCSYVYCLHYAVSCTCF